MAAQVPPRRLLRLLGALALAGALAVSLVLAGTWLEHRMPLVLPRPTGRFAVGRTTLYWINTGRVDEFAPVPGTPRRLVAWIWYPSVPSAGKPAEYLPGPWRAAFSRNSGVLMSDFLTRDFARVRVHSREDVELAPDQRTYPVVILRGGLAALVTTYTVLAEDLASHGYIVVGIDAAYRTTVVVLPDGRTVVRPAQYNLELMPPSEEVPFATRLLTMWAADVEFTIDELAEIDADPSGRFAGRLDLQHLGIFGHSLGGATAADFCHEDSRCKAGIDLDGRLLGPVIKEGLRQPFMFILEDHRRRPDPEHIIADMQSMYDKLPVNSRLKISLAGANHFSFSDQILLKSPILQAIMRRIGLIPGLEGRRGLAITASYVDTFFDVYLKGFPRATLDGLATRYPEVIIE